MHRCLFLLAAVLFLSGPALAQAPSDSPTLRAILDELRQIRQDLHATSIAAQRSQILLYRLHSQEAVVARASQRLDDARSKLAQVQAAQKKMAEDMQRYKNWVKDHTEDSAEKKQIEDYLAQQQVKLEVQASEEQQLQGRVIEAEQQLRLDQAKLTALEDQLDQLDRELQSSARPQR